MIIGAILTTVTACLFSAGSGALIVLPDVRLVLMHTNDYMENKLQRLEAEGVDFNHPYAGESCSLSSATVAYPKLVEDSGYEFHRMVVHLGAGGRVFRKATSIMRSLGMVNRLSWAKMVVQGKGCGNTRDEDLELDAGDMVASEVKCYGFLWSFNPSRIVCNDLNRPGTAELAGVRVSQLAYSTVRGTLLAGEERFRVLYNSEGDQNVFFEAMSFTRGAGLLGSLAMPLIRPLQKQFFRGVCCTMSREAAVLK